MTTSMNRRQFVKRSLTGTVGTMVLPTILPAGVISGRNRIMPNDRINLGFIGVGGMGSGHLRSFLGYDDVRVMAICDVKKEQRDKSKQTVDSRYGNNECVTYNDYRELLVRKDIDAIVMAAPDHWHALIGVEAARQGKAMYHEKPLGLTVEECQVMRKVVKRYNTCFQHGTQQRSDPQFRFAVEMVRNGKIGNIKRIVAEATGCRTVPYPQEEPVPEGFDYNLWLGPAPLAPYSELRCTRDFMHIKDYSLGGLSGAWGIHHIDIVQWALDADNSGPVEIEGTGSYPLEGLFNTYHSYEVEYKYPNGEKLLYIDRDTVRSKIPQFKAPSSMAILFEGTEGWIYVARGYLDAYPKKLLNTVIGPNEFKLPFSNDHRRNYLDAVRTGSKPISTIESAIKSEIICQQAYIAMELEQKLYWDNENEKFINNIAANKMLSRPMRSPWHL
ncbi:MAG: Gfo/Idh/MocA family oxidoreductase [Mariniphaga sp.]|nr:Gfo/Idh/MocA family oxidoreductase [Mariniphaga sp.]